MLSLLASVCRINLWVCVMVYSLLLHLWFWLNALSSCFPHFHLSGGHSKVPLVEQWIRYTWGYVPWAIRRCLGTIEVVSYSSGVCNPLLVAGAFAVVSRVHRRLWILKNPNLSWLSGIYPTKRGARARTSQYPLFKSITVNILAADNPLRASEIFGNAVDSSSVKSISSR